MNLSSLSSLGTMVPIIVAVPFVIIALGLVWSALNGYRQTRASQNWQETTGTILYSGVQERRSSNGRGGRSVSYYPQVVYEYRVMGQQFQGNQIRFGGEVGFGFYGMVERRVTENFPVGKQVSVFYNPDAPQQAVLERKTSSRSPILIGVAIFIIIMLVITLVPTLFIGQFTQMFTQFGR
jgi:uncharacterized membrane protein